MAKGQECIRFETLKSRLENIQQKPLEQHKTDRIHGVTWWVLDLMIPGARSPIPGFVPDLIQGGRGRAGCRPGRASATFVSRRELRSVEARIGQMRPREP